METGHIIMCGVIVLLILLNIFLIRVYLKDKRKVERFLNKNDLPTDEEDEPNNER